MTRTEIKNILLNSLDNAKEASGGKQVICRCHLPGCNDTKQHLYIGRFDSSDEPLFYNCFKCHQSGIINKNFSLTTQSIIIIVAGMICGMFGGIIGVNKN